MVGVGTLDHTAGVAGLLDLAGAALLDGGRDGLTADIGGVREVLGDSGFLVPVGDVSELATSLSKLIRIPQLRERLGNSACQRVLADFSLDDHILNMQGVFERYAQ